jgi:hypothetical protein
VGLARTLNQIGCRKELPLTRDTLEVRRPCNVVREWTKFNEPVDEIHGWCFCSLTACRPAASGELALAKEVCRIAPLVSCSGLLAGTRPQERQHVLRRLGKPYNAHKEVNTQLSIGHASHIQRAAQDRRPLARRCINVTRDCVAKALAGLSS